jgi:hypothetical protein
LNLIITIKQACPKQNIEIKNSIFRRFKMKQWTKYIIIIILVVTTLSSATVAFADNGDTPGQGPRRGRGLGGEVTAVGDSGLTLRTRSDETVEVKVNDETRVILVESQSEGSLSDIEVGDKVGIRGRKNEDGVVEGRAILVAPDGDRIGGKVTAVDGTTISVENPQGSATIITNADTLFRSGREESSLAEVTEGKLVIAFGTAQDDGSLAARLVLVGNRQGPERGQRARLGGEVTAINGTTFTLNTRRGNELTILTDDSTEYRTRGDQAVSFADIEVGKKVMVIGQPVEGQENTIQARVVGILIQRGQ